MENRCPFAAVLRFPVFPFSTHHTGYELGGRSGGSAIRQELMRGFVIPALGQRMVAR